MNPDLFAPYQTIGTQRAVLVLGPTPWGRDVPWMDTRP
jgi:hypothetical protein